MSCGPSSKRLVLSFLLLGTVASSGLAQAPAGGAPKSVSTAAKQLLEGSEQEILETDDGVLLSINYWSPADAGKTTPVVVLLHMRGKSQLDWFPLAKELRDNGVAVVTFDFRGHGDSRAVNPEIYDDPVTVERREQERRIRNAQGLRVVAPGSRERSRQDSARRPDTIDQAEEFRSGRHFGSFLARDIQAVKRFLIHQNNAGRLNIRRLGLVAAGEGCSVAMVWLDEWEYRDPIRTGHVRQGGDLGALVLVNPIWNYSGLKAPVSFGEGSDALPILLISGDKGKSQSDAARFAKLMRIPLPSDTGSRFRPDSVWLKIDSALAGTDLVQAPEFQLTGQIRDFLRGRLTADVRQGWEKRSLDVDQGGFGSGR